MSSCHACGAPLAHAFSLGRMPLANGFLKPDAVSSEFFFDLALGSCSECLLVQLENCVDRERMFHDRYAYYSSTSQFMREHFRELAHQVQQSLLLPSPGEAAPFVVEIGSNDGIFLEHVRAAGFRHLGIDPSANVARAARERGVETWVEFFDADVARRVVSVYGKADAIVAANVMCHVPYIGSVLEGVRQLLQPTGTFVFEDPYWPDILVNNAIDQIYDEHAFYFSLHSVIRLLARHGLELVDVKRQSVHGGSMRYVVALTGARVPSTEVERLVVEERKVGVHDPSSLSAFRVRVLENAGGLRSLILQLRRQGKRVVGYGATAKSATILNLAGIGPEQLEYICDTTPIKQGTLSPGMHVPVVPHEVFVEQPPDVALLLAWNHAREILAKESAFIARGGRFIRYVPTVGIF